MLSLLRAAFKAAATMLEAAADESLAHRRRAHRRHRPTAVGMSRRRGTQHRRRRARLHNDALVLTRVAVITDRSDPEVVGRAKQLTHDRVLAGAGTTARSRVRWRIIPNDADGAIAVLERFDQAARAVGHDVPDPFDPPPGVEVLEDHGNGYQPLIEIARRHPAGAIIVAMVDTSVRRKDVSPS